MDHSPAIVSANASSSLPSAAQSRHRSGPRPWLDGPGLLEHSLSAQLPSSNRHLSHSNTRLRNPRPFSAFLAPPGRLLASTPFSTRSGSSPIPEGQALDSALPRNPTEPCSGDELPSYTRRPPANGIRPASYSGSSLAAVPNLRGSHRMPYLFSSGSSQQQPSRTPSQNLKPHIVTSTSGKIQLTLFSPSQARYPVLLQGVDQELKGELKLNLGDYGESFSEIRVKCKGVVSTLVVRSQGNSSGNALHDETVFMQFDQSLYQPPLLSTSDHRLSGTKSFPFTFALPTSTDEQSALPPSFALTSSAPDPMSSFTRHNMPLKIIEWASIKYYVKVTLARRGILRTNDRLLAPFVLLSKQSQPPITSLTRLAALNLGLALPTPMQDPEGWMGRKIRQHIKLPSSNPLRAHSQTAWYEVMVLLPSPLCYARNKPLPYYLKFTSSDPSITTDFSQSFFKVSLIQRAILTALGVSGTHENSLSKGTSRPDGPNNGIHAPCSTNANWSRRYQGDLLLVSTAVPNFSCQNITIQYYFNVSVSVPNQAADLHISLPIQLVSAPRQTTTPRSEEPTEPTIPSGGTSESAGPATDDLPPSYWDVQDMDSHT